MAPLGKGQRFTYRCFYLRRFLMANSKKSKGQRPDKTILVRTLLLMLLCGVVVFAALGVRLYKLMIVDHDYYEGLAIEQQTRETTVAASRGTIYDTNGNALAVSATAYNVFISPAEMQMYNESPDYVARGLSEILGVDYDSIIEKSKDTRSWYKTIATKIEPDLHDEVLEFINSYTSVDEDGKTTTGLKSVHLEVTSKRYYPYSSLACHVVGFVGTDNYGLEGIELLYNDYLEGTDGSVVRLSASNGIELLFESYENYNDAIDGCDLTLTLDITIQNIAEKYLEQAMEDNMIRNGGCVIVMNVNTGEILALANANGYDLNSPLTLSDEVYEELELVKEEDEDEYLTQLQAEQLKQWRNMAISDTYEPGSVFKIITMSMALEEGVVTENSTFYCGGSLTGIPGRVIPLNCWKTAGHGSQTLKEAAQHSCNVAFVNIGLAVGADTFYDYVEAFGLWDKTGIDLSGESSTRGLWWTDDVFKDPTNKSQLAAASFGQTANVTPIQMITAVAATVNGGYLMEPYIVSEVTDADGNIVYSKEPTVVRQVISEETSKIVSSILEAVVGEPEGTGKNAYVAGYRVGGKTGTTTKTSLQASTGVKEYMVSFCGIAPADDPEIAVLVVLDNPAPSSESGVYISGGAMAAPAVGRIMSEVLPYLGVEPVYNEEEVLLLDVTMPKVIGSSIDDAKTALEEKGLSVKVVGDGDTVTDQLPNANVDIAAESTVIIYADSEKKTDDVTVPNLSGMTATQARKALANVGLFMDTAGALPTSSNIVVSRQSVASGESVQYGSIISVTLIDKSTLGYY